jgi:DNA polymerase III subunit delta'
MLNSIDLLPNHQNRWSALQSTVQNKRLAQSLLLVGSSLSALDQFAYRFIASLFCEKICGHCQDCLMFLQGVHPCLQIIKPEKNTAPIKVDQIRALQTTVYQTPPRGSLYCVLIQSADKMNQGAANALLKILEEPPKHTQFILLAEHISTLPATIRSRCQIWFFPSPCENIQPDLLESYRKEPTKSHILDQKESLLLGLLALLKGELTASTLAALWKDLAFHDLLWFLYLVHAQLLLIYTLPACAVHPLFFEILALINPKILFAQLDKLHILQKKIRHTLQMNTTLALEDLLVTFANRNSYA